MKELAIALSALLAVSACGKKDDGETKPEPAPEAKTDDTDKPPEPPEPDPALVERGAYIAAVAGCPQCHTPVGPQGPDMAKMWAGGLEVTEEFGTWRSPNITQDKKTGIGDWTDEQIVAAIREGKRPDGTKIFPIMPYMYYNKLSDDDAKAIVAFLRTIPPIENAVEGNSDIQLPAPPVPPPSGEAPPPDDPVKQGEYLVALMHCHMCHTPMTEKGPDMEKSFAGGFKIMMPEGFEAFVGSGHLYSSNITQDKKTGIGDWTDEEIAASFTEMKKKDGSPVRGPMLFYQPGWSKLEPEDAKAIVAFLRTIPPIKNKVPEGDYKPPAGPPPGAAPPKQ